MIYYSKVNYFALDGRNPINLLNTAQGFLSPMNQIGNRATPNGDES